MSIDPVLDDHCKPDTWRNLWKMAGARLPSDIFVLLTDDICFHVEDSVLVHRLPVISTARGVTCISGAQVV